MLQGREVHRLLIEKKRSLPQEREICEMAYFTIVECRKDTGKDLLSALFRDNLNYLGTKVCQDSSVFADIITGWNMAFNSMVSVEHSEINIPVNLTRLLDDVMQERSMSPYWHEGIVIGAIESVHLSDHEGFQSSLLPFLKYGLEKGVWRDVRFTEGFGRVNNALSEHRSCIARHRKSLIETIANPKVFEGIHEKDQQKKLHTIMVAKLVREVCTSFGIADLIEMTRRQQEIVDGREEAHERVVQEGNKGSLVQTSIIRT